MDRREAVLRELNLYPLWVQRGEPLQTATTNVGAIDKTTSHSTRLSKDDSQVAGYHESPLRQLSKDTSQVASYPNPPRSPLVRGEDNQLSGSSPGSPPDKGAGGLGRLGGVAVEPTSLTPSPSPAYGRGEINWPELKHRVRDCTACRLRAGCTQTVFGVGDESADWLFVGEGPGADEDALGEPFVGQAGKLLDNMLMAIRLKRGENVYIANIVKCRPPGNRAPAADEIAQCLPYLQRQIELIQPKLIVALGKVASNALLGKEATIASLRGKLHDYQMATATGLDGGRGDESSRLPPLMELPAIRLGEQTTLAKSLVVPHQTTSSHRVRTAIPLIVTYHPAYLLRSPTEKAKAWQDLCLATDTMQKL